MTTARILARRALALLLPVLFRLASASAGTIGRMNFPFITITSRRRPPASAAATAFDATAGGDTAAVGLMKRCFIRLQCFATAPRSAQFVVVCLSLWFTVTANWALWHRLGHLNSFTGSLAVLRLEFGLLVFLATLLLLSVTAWPRGMKPVWAVLLVVAACSQHFMLQYGVVMDSGMLMNAVQTNLSEARDLFSWQLAAHVLLVALPPMAWLWRLQLRRDGVRRNLVRSILLLVASTVLLGVAVFAMYRQLAPLVRNNMELRFSLNPLSPVTSAGKLAFKPLFSGKKPFILISAGTALGMSYSAQARPPLLVLVVGETARSDHFGLNGYGRDTTPGLAQRGVVSWRNVRSCGTNTLASVPCMFSHLGKAAFERRNADYENLLDVLQAAGLAVLWIDNQSGCKNVCNRVASVFASDNLQTPAGKKWCANGECMDTMLLQGLDERIALLPAERRKNGVVVVMHQMGSHGPAYHRRSTPETKRFLPECTNHALAECDHAALINAYDNSIAYTDHFLAKTIDWLDAQKSRFDGGMLYLSDHGESLGEYGLFLHGLPYALAPDAQKHVPMVAWMAGLGQRQGLATACLQASRETALTHDNLYHTVLGLLDVQTPTYSQSLDAFAACRPEVQQPHRPGQPG